jgi:hypothetical protein
VRGDDKSEDFQQGVERVRAITAIWSKTTLVSMFILYADTTLQLMSGDANTS